MVEWSGFMEEINFKRRVKTKRFLKSLFIFMVNSEALDFRAANSDLNVGHVDYYLIHSDEYTKEEFEDNIKFAKTMEYLNRIISLKSNLEEYLTISVEKVWAIANADVIFKFSFHNPKFKEWQSKLFELLTFQNLFKE